MSLVLQSLMLIGLILGLMALFGLVLNAWGSRRWSRDSQRLGAELDAGRLPAEPRRVDFRELAELPSPVQDYFRTVLRDGQPIITAVRLWNRGTINLSESGSQWKPFTAQQRVVTRRPGFDWDARVRMAPGLTVRVHDAYLAGTGLLRASLGGLFTIAEIRGTPEVAHGELMRYLAEAVWYPTALLPSQGVRWEPVDARSARATLTDGSTAATLTFTFNPQGFAESVSAQARSRVAGKSIIPTPWQGRFWNYQERGGMRVPTEAEVAWLLPEGVRPYWRGQTTAVEYEFAH